MKYSQFIYCLVTVSLLCLPASNAVVATGSMGPNGVKFTCTVSGTITFGTTVAAIGDVNGDGISDFAIGTPSYSSSAGMVAIVYGTNSTMISQEVCQNSNFTRGYKIFGPMDTTNKFGTSISTAGDINGDGIPDLVVGAPGYTVNSNAVGKAYIIFLPKTAPTTDLSITSYTSGYSLTGTTSGDLVGQAVSYAGDVDGDGKPDVAIGAPGVSSGKGAVYIVYGTNSTTALSTSTSASSSYFSVTTTTATAALGTSITYYYDINSDGKTEILIGAPGATLYAVWVIYGQGGRTRTNIAVDTASATDVYKITSTTVIGATVLTADVNNDGILDIITSAALATSTSTPKLFVIFGSYLLSQINAATTADISSISSPNGLILTASGTQNGLGFGLAISDLNQDGVSDIVVGIPGDTSNQGTVSAIYGANSLSALTLDSRVTPFTTSSGLGNSVATQDFNFDGVPDLLVGAQNELSRGTVYLILGTCTREGYSYSNGVCCNTAVGMVGNNGHCCTSGQYYSLSAGKCLAASATTQVTTSSSSGLSGGQIAGIVLGTVAFVFISASIIVYTIILKKRIAKNPPLVKHLPQPHSAASEQV